MSTQFKNAVSAAIDTFATDKNLVSGYYGPYLDDAKRTVGEAVSEKATQVADALRSAAQEEGLSESLFENVLIQVGLVDEPEPEVEEPAADETLDDKVERLLVAQQDQAAQIASLIAAAKRHGISVG